MKKEFPNTAFLGNSQKTKLIGDARFSRRTANLWRERRKGQKERRLFDSKAKRKQSTWDFQRTILMYIINDSPCAPPQNQLEQRDEMLHVTEAEYYETHCKEYCSNGKQELDENSCVSRKKAWWCASGVCNYAYVHTAGARRKRVWGQLADFTLCCWRRWEIRKLFTTTERDKKKRKSFVVSSNLETAMHCV